MGRGGQSPTRRRTDCAERSRRRSRQKRRSKMSEPRDRLRKRLYGVAAVIALLGLADGIYLTIEHVTGRTAECIASSGCQDVFGSKSPENRPLPLAALGSFAYFTVFSAALLAAFGYRKCGSFFPPVVTVMF